MRFFCVCFVCIMLRFSDTLPVTVLFMISASVCLAARPNDIIGKIIYT